MARFFWWRKRGWWHEPAGIALFLALILPSGMLAIPVSQPSVVWAAPAAALAGLAIALAATVGFFIVKRHSWLLAAPLSFGLSFSFALALVNGWNAQINLAITITEVVAVVGAIGVTVVAFVVLGRGFRRFNRAQRDIAREIGEKISHESLFRDDGERIVIYANRGKLLGRLGLQVFGGVLIAALFIWLQRISGNDLRLLLATIAAGFLFAFGFVSISLTIIRIAMSSPTLVVNADGINDNGSLHVAGRGLLRWNEVLGVREYYIDLSDVSLRFRMSYSQLNDSLDIYLADFRAVRQRQPLWKRTLAIWAGGGQQPLGPRILPALLDRPAAQLVAEINRYIHTHAPEGSWHKAVTGDEPEQLGED